MYNVSNEPAYSFLHGLILLAKVKIMPEPDPRLFEDENFDTTSANPPRSAFA